MSFYDCNATNLQIIHFLRVRFAKYSFLELFFSGDTQVIIQGAGSNESVENTCTRNEVETTVSGNKSMQSQTQHVAGSDVHSFPNDFSCDAKNLQIIYFLRNDLQNIHF